MSPRSLAALICTLFLGCSPTGIASDACKSYLVCLERLGNDTGSVAKTFGDRGTCWQNATTAASCDDACEKALDDIRESEPDAGC